MDKVTKGEEAMDCVDLDFGDLWKYVVLGGILVTWGIFGIVESGEYNLGFWIGNLISLFVSIEIINVIISQGLNDV